MMYIFVDWDKENVTSFSTLQELNTYLSDNYFDFNAQSNIALYFVSSWEEGIKLADGSFDWVLQFKH